MKLDVPNAMLRIIMSEEFPHQRPEYKTDYNRTHFQAATIKLT